MLVALVLVLVLVALTPSCRRAGAHPFRRSLRPRLVLAAWVLLFLPELGGAVITAAAFGAILFTRFVPAMALGGLIVLGGGLVLTGVASGSDALVLLGTAGVGVGVGASVSPTLFSTGFSLPSAQLPPIFALVELLRGAAFLAGGRGAGPGDIPLGRRQVAAARRRCLARGRGPGDPLAAAWRSALGVDERL